MWIFKNIFLFKIKSTFTTIKGNYNPFRVDAVPHVESERAVLVTEFYKETEGLSPILRRAKAAEKIFNICLNLFC